MCIGFYTKYLSSLRNDAGKRSVRVTTEDVLCHRNSSDVKTANLIFVDDVKRSLSVDAGQRDEDAGHDAEHDALHRETAESLLLVNAEEEATRDQTTARHDRLGHVPLQNQHRENDDENDRRRPRNLRKSRAHATIIHVNLPSVL